MQTRGHLSARALIQRHAVLLFYALALALALGPTLILAGPSALLTTGFLGGDAELASAADLDPLMIVIMLAGAPSFALVAILVIALAFDRAGLRDLRSRLFRWRVGVGWYAVALLTAPLLWMTIQGALLLTSEAFLPGIITAEDKVGVPNLIFNLIFAATLWVLVAVAAATDRRTARRPRVWSTTCAARAGR